MNSLGNVRKYKHDKWGTQQLLYYKSTKIQQKAKCGHNQGHFEFLISNVGITKDT